MPRATVQLASVLAGAVGAERIEVEAATVRGALDAAVVSVPALRVHLFDESGALREHVLCLHGERTTRRPGGLDAPLADGDRVRVLQAVSGG